jgi:AcrR family transcriptional regulator
MNESNHVIRRRRNYKRDGVRAQRAAETRQRLLDTAKSLFIAQGYDGVSVSTIAAEAGIAVGTIFHHFRGKSGLMGALWAEVIGEAVEIFKEAMLRNGHKSARAALHAGVDALISTAFQNLPFWQLGMSVFIAHPEIAADHAVKIWAGYQRVVLQVCAKDVPQENLSDFAPMVGGVINTMLRRAIVLGTSEAETRRLSKVQLDWLLIGAAAPGAARLRSKKATVPRKFA